MRLALATRCAAVLAFEYEQLSRNSPLHAHNPESPSRTTKFEKRMREQGTAVSDVCCAKEFMPSCSHAEFIHTRRMPEALANRCILVTDLDVGLMHFQVVNWHNFILK